MPANPPKPEGGVDLGRAYVPPNAAPKAIIVDLDGTFALMNGRGPHEYHRVGEDLPNRAIVNLVDWVVTGFSRWTRQDLEVIFMSGRNEKCRPETELWLSDRGYEEYPLFMRPDLPDGVQQPKDSVVKLALFNEHVRDHYDVQFVLDDRDQVVEMWRSLGITCLQVAPGDF